MMFSQSTRRTNDTMFRMNIRPPPLQPPLPIPVVSGGDKKKMIWGEPTWWFLHTVAHKVVDFPKVRSGLLNIIYQTCVNLPCPVCAKHAKTYLDGINFNTIQTKEDLKRVLFVFHNVVNERKGVPLFPADELDAKYSTANTRNIFNNFIRHFQDRNRSPGLIADDLFRAKLAREFVGWFNANGSFFLP